MKPMFLSTTAGDHAQMRQDMSRLFRMKIESFPSFYLVTKHGTKTESRVLELDNNLFHLLLCSFKQKLVKVVKDRLLRFTMILMRMLKKDKLEKKHNCRIARGRAKMFSTMLEKSKTRVNRHL